jgi:hypothetical protein
LQRLIGVRLVWTRLVYCVCCLREQLYQFPLIGGSDSQYINKSNATLFTGSIYLRPGKVPMLDESAERDA